MLVRFWLVGASVDTTSFTKSSIYFVLSFSRVSICSLRTCAVVPSALRFFTGGKIRLRSDGAAIGFLTNYQVRIASTKEKVSTLERLICGEAPSADQLQRLDLLESA